MRLKLGIPLVQLTKTCLPNQSLQNWQVNTIKTVVQIILHWHVQTGNIVIPGSKNPVHIDSNLDIFDFELTEADLEQISQIDKGKRFFNLPKWMHRLFLLAYMNYDKQA